MSREQGYKMIVREAGAYTVVLVGTIAIMLGIMLHEAGVPLTWAAVNGVRTCAVRRDTARFAHTISAESAYKQLRADLCIRPATPLSQ